MKTPQMTIEEREEFRRIFITPERPICWWCRHRPVRKRAENCGRDIDWRETIGMERKFCREFDMDWRKLHTRPADVLPPRADQLTLNL
jgi:hypothetical protein